MNQKDKRIKEAFKHMTGWHRNIHFNKEKGTSAANAIFGLKKKKLGGRKQTKQIKFSEHEITDHLKGE